MIVESSRCDMANILVEKRTFINKDKYEQLMHSFQKENMQMQKENQVIYKYKSDLDFRLLFDKKSATLRLRGIPGSDMEKSVHIKPEEVFTLISMLRHLGMYEEMKWYRIRTTILSQEYLITMDETYQYGYVVSIAKEVPLEQKDQAMQELDQLFDRLQIPITTKEQFHDRYKYYKLKWVDFAKNIDERAFISRN